jgi:hypothetical protein
MANGAMFATLTNRIISGEVRVENDSIRLGVTMVAELEFEFKKFL